LGSGARRESRIRLQATNVVVKYKPAVTKAPTTTYYAAEAFPTCAGSIKPYFMLWGSDAVLACPDQNADTGVIGLAWFDNTTSWGIWYQAGSMYAQRVSARFNSGEHQGTMQGLLVAKKPLAFVTCKKGISKMTFDMTMVFTMYS
jgi:hypothetical protein